MSQIKRLGGDSLLYALMNVGTKLIAFLMLPIYTTYLNPTEMGVFENVDAFTTMLTFLVIFGTDNALAYYYYDTKDQLEKSRYVETVLFFRISIALFLLIVSFIMGPWISKIITGSSEYSSIIQIAMIVLVIESVITVVLTYYRYEFKSFKVMIFTILKLGLVAILSFIFLKYYAWKIEAIYYGRLISIGLIFNLLIMPILRFLKFKINKDRLKEILSYAAPLVPASIAFWIIASANRFFLSHFESLESVGIYGVAVKFATVITLLTSSVQMAWRPYSMSIKEKPDAKNLFSKFYMILLILGFFGLLAIATFIPYILTFMIPNEAFSSASKYVAILSLGTFLNFYYLIISVGLFIEKQTKVISIYFMYAAILSIILNLILIPIFSLWGAASAVTISYLFAAVMIFIKSQKVYYVPVPIMKVLLIFINGTIAMLSIVYIQVATNLAFYWQFIPWVYFMIIIVLSGILKEIRISRRVGQ